MNSLAHAFVTQPVSSRTENGMKAQESTMSATVDLFYKIGASRGKYMAPEFAAAFAHDADIALRIALWSRDVRGGAGERQIFRDILQHLERHQPQVLTRKFLSLVPEVGRWDDLLVFNYNPSVKNAAYTLIHDALMAGNGLCAKWMPRKGAQALELPKAFGMSPKTYRKTLVNLTKVVETHMCAKQFDQINYSHVPSLAMSRYLRAFVKNDNERFNQYRKDLAEGKTKVNASAVYPYDIIKSIYSGGDPQVCSAQWDALPNYMNGTNVLPMVDVSGSMCVPINGNKNLTAVEVAISLGLYCADKTQGAFKDMYLTFSENTKLCVAKGDLASKVAQLRHDDWGMNTNLHAAFDQILNVATKNNVPQKDMPQILLILSDMQFDECAKFDDSAYQMIQRKFAVAGYTTPAIVFWNLASRDNVPVSFNEQGVALISGFSPSIMKSVLAFDFDSISPEAIMRAAVCIDRYNYN